MRAATAVVVAVIPFTAAERTTVRPCTGREVWKLVSSFPAALNRGDLSRLDAIFAREPYFRWYSTNGPGERLGAAAFSRRTLNGYFAARHRSHERQSLIRFRYNGNTRASPAYGNFEYDLTRRADDLAPTRYSGKGAAMCTSGADRIIVWSMGKA